MFHNNINRIKNFGPQPSTKDILFSNALVFGKNAATCKCGDTEYNVTDVEGEPCEKIACFDGEPGNCVKSDVYRWAHYGVVCGGKESTDVNEKPIKWTDSDYFIGKDDSIVLNWDHRTVCPTSNKTKCTTFVQCFTKQYNKWMCVGWDDTNSKLHTYTYEGCYTITNTYQM